MSSLREGILWILGNPLLDIQGKVDKAFLDKWGLKENDAILVDDKLLPMFDELVEKCKDTVEYVAGGAAQNTARVAQWMLKKPNSVVYMGCIGKDKYGEILQQKAHEVGVNAVYQYHPTDRTGKCAVCLTGLSRSLVAHLAAANHFTVSHLEVPENWKLVTQADYYYTTGFHLTVCPPAILKAGAHAAKENKCFTMNLSAPFISSLFKEQQLATLPYVDILFGNETEAETFSKDNEFGTTSIGAIALKIAGMPKVNVKRPRIVIITQGSNPTIVAQDQKIQEFPVSLLEKDKIVDTNGAGDAFAGGFLSQLVQGQPLAKCIDAAHWAARVIIQRSGCTYPQVCEYQAK